MTINTAIRCFSPIGANFYLADTIQGFRLGEIATGENGSVWMYVKNGSASVAINAFECCGVDATGAANAVVSAVANDATKLRNVGWPQAAIPASGFGWIAIRFNSGVKIKAKASTAINAQLYIGASGVSAGVVASTSATNTAHLNGVSLVVAAGASGTTSIEAIGIYPRFIT